MAGISEDKILEIRRANDIVDVISEYISLIPRGKNFFGVCPFHDDHSPSLSVSREKQIYTCFVCKSSGNVFTFIRDYENIPFLDAVKRLADRAGILVDYTGTNPKNESFKDYYDMYDTALKFYKNNLNTKLGNEAKSYLTKRGLDADTINTFDIGLSLKQSDALLKVLEKKYELSKILKSNICNMSNGSVFDTFKNRIMFPLKDLDGNTVGFSARIYDTSEGSKYVNSAESQIFKKSKLLYNYHNARDEIRKKKEIILCEGFMDVIRLYTIGVKNAVAIMGTAFTEDHLEIIKKLHVPVTLCLDNDEPGKNATVQNGDMLDKAGIETSVIVFDKYKDVDEYILNNGAEAFIKCYNNKVGFIDFKLDRLKKDKNLKDTTDLSAFINSAIEAINKIDDDILRELKIKELSKEYDINEEIIRSKITNTNKKEIKEVKKSIQKQKKIYNKYQISEFRIIYLMLNYPEVIRIYEKNLGHLINQNMKRLANEIVYYKDEHGGFEYADFLGYIINIEPLYEAYKEVVSYPQIESYTSEELEDYITTIQKGSYKQEVEKLKLKMKDTLDINEKAKIASKIEKMKKEVLKW